MFLRSQKITKEKNSNNPDQNLKKFNKKHKDIEILDITRVKEPISLEHDNTLKKDFIVFKNVVKTYDNTQVAFRALDNVSFSINEGELVVILGNSGAGKSTALNILGGIDTISAGAVIVDGEPISTYQEEELTNFRRNNIGFIFQFYNLIQNLTIIENVELSYETKKEHLDAYDVLKKVGLANNINKFPAQLSGGEQQRTSIARALVKKPKILLCDEPTGALDYITGKNVLKLIQHMCREYKITVIIVTHNSAIAPMADRVIQFKSGQIISNELNNKVVDIEAIEW